MATNGNYFNANNVFSSWDLNPLSQQTGIARDDLAQQRDAYLQPLYQQYRSAVGVGGGAGHATHSPTWLKRLDQTPT